jgi:hypothetical protein
MIPVVRVIPSARVVITVVVRMMIIVSPAVVSGRIFTVDSYRNAGWIRTMHYAAPAKQH